MTPRSLWFVAGSAAGVYASVKARRLAHRLSLPGMVDQASALGTGWRAFSAEVRDGMHSREAALVRDLHDRAALTPRAAPTTEAAASRPALDPYDDEKDQT